MIQVPALGQESPERRNSLHKTDLGGTARPNSNQAKPAAMPANGRDREPGVMPAP